MKTNKVEMNIIKRGFFRGSRSRFLTSIVLILAMVIVYSVPIGAMAMEDHSDFDIAASIEGDVSLTGTDDQEEIPVVIDDEITEEEIIDEIAEEEIPEEIIEEETPEEIVALGGMIDSDSNITNWRKTPESNAIRFPGAATSSANSKIFTWNWSSVNSWLPSSALSSDNVWDLTSNNHAGQKYVDNTAVTSFNAASWSNTAGNDSTMRRFQGTFTMPSGFSAVDDFYIDSVRESGKIAINDLMFVFMYPADYQMTDENFLEQFAFWAGDVNTQISYEAAKSFHGQSRVNSAKNDAYSIGTAKKGETLGAETLYHTDGRFVISGAGITGLNEAIRIASQRNDIRNWTVDIITADYYDGGGMDQLRIACSKNPENVALTVNYWKLDSNGQNPVPAYMNGKASRIVNITNDAVGKAYVLSGDLLNANKPAGFSSGVQQGAEVIVSGINNIIDVYYTPDGVTIDTKTVSFIAGDNGSLDDKNAITSGSYNTNTPWANLPWGYNPSFIPAAVADEGYQFDGWLFTKDDGDTAFLVADGKGGYVWPSDKLDKDYEFTAIFGPDYSQTKMLSYSIDYYKEGAIEEELTQIVKEEVWINDDDILDVDIDDINIVNAFGEGFTFEKTAPTAIPESIKNEGIIDVFYVAETPEPTPTVPADPETPGTQTPAPAPTPAPTPAPAPRPVVPPVIQAVAPLIAPAIAPLLNEVVPELLQITEAIVPQATGVIGDNLTPQGSNAAWALLNLILTIITGLMMIALFAAYMTKKKDKYEDDPDMDENVNKHLGIRLISIIVAAVAIIVFMMTEDMSLPMQWTDRYTSWMVVILVVQIIVSFFSKKKYTEEELDPENA